MSIEQDRTITIVILAGIYCGASAAWKVSGPMMFPTQKDIRTMAFMVTRFVWPATTLSS